jgi:hypothetical protein
MSDKHKGMFGRFTRRLLAAAVLAGFGAQPALAQSGLSQEVLDQLAALKAEKAALTPSQKKLSSQLWHALQESRGRALPGLAEVYSGARQLARLDAESRSRVTIAGTISGGLLRHVRSVGGTIIHASPRAGQVDAWVPLAGLESLAARTDVGQIYPAAEPSTNVGALTAQGYISHKANQVVNGLGFNGSGVVVGVLSDSAQSIPTLIGSGDLSPLTTTLPGQAGSGSSEGSAMMEIIQDMAPGVRQIFATAFNGVASFADNIRALRAAGADIIVDDVSYFNEGVFQDGPIAQAVNDVVADGALVFSSAGNSGNVSSGTAGVWEGDFNPGAVVVTPDSYTLHRFPGGLDYNTLTVASSRVTLKWSDRLGASANDYDLWVTNSTGTSLLCYGGATQTGTQDPYEICSGSLPVGARVYVGNYLGTAQTRALHVNTNRGALSTFTSGVVYGHNAGRNTVSTAAVYWNSARTGTKPFVGGAANPTERFSSDGPRRIFYLPDGSEITPGNLLFSTNGGEVLAKPDIAAADGVSTKTPGFLPFYGTSAAAPSAAGVAALVMSARPDYTAAQVLHAMKQTALDIRAAGIDRDAGHGIVMAKEAVDYAIAH